MEKQKSPELRFSQFKNDWYETTLGDVVDIVGGGTPDTNVPEFWNGDIDWYSPTEIGENVYANGSTKKITALGLKSSSAKILPAKKTVLFSSRAGIGDMAILDKPAATNQGFQSFIANNIDVYFLYSMGVKIKKFALSKASGSTFLEISRNQLAQMAFFAPSAESGEQTQIGNFFQNLDQSIALHEKKLTQTQNLKKAMLEKMFPKAGSTQPEIRLKGFSGDWKGLIISDLIEGGIIDKPMDGNHGELHPTSADYIKSGIAFVMANDISNGQLNLKKCKNISYKLSKTLQKGFAVENDVLLTHKATIGETAIVPKLNTPYLVLTPQVTYYRVLNSLKLSNFFLQYSFQASYFKKAMSLAVTGATRLYIGITEQQQLPFLITSSKEQEAIGQFFKQLDETLVLQHQQLQTLKNLKQAFLEKMFV